MNVDSAGVPEASCSGQHNSDGECFTCGHPTAEHDERLVCRRCHEICRYCGQFRDQHVDQEWRSCQDDLRLREDEADALAWWRSQQGTIT